MLQTGQWFGVQRFALSNDGKYLLATGGESSAKLYDTASGVELREFGGHVGEVAGLTFSHDDFYAATTGWDGALRVWNVKTGALLKSFHAPHGPLYSASFSQDNHLIAAGGEKFTAYIWEIETGREIRTVSNKPPFEALDGVTFIKFLPGGKRLLTGDVNFSIYDLTTPDKVLRAGLPSNGALSGDGSLLVTGLDNSPDGRDGIQIIDTVTGLTKVLAYVSTEHLAISPDKHLIAAVDLQGFGRVWEVSSGREVQRFQHPTKGITSIAFSPQGREFATAGDDGRIRFWDALSAREVRPAIGPNGGVGNVSFSVDGSSVFAGCRTSQWWSLCRWKLTTGALEWQVGITAHLLFTPRFGPGHGPIAVREDDGILLIDRATGQASRVPVDGPGSGSALAFSRDGRVMLSGIGVNQRAAVWDLGTRRLVRTLDALRGGWRVSADVAKGTGNSAVDGWLSSLALSPDDQLAAGGTTEGHVHLWNLATGREIATFTQGGETDSVSKVSFSPDGKRLLTASGDKTSRIWDVVTHKELLRMEDTGGSAVFSPHGRHVITNLVSNAARLWNGQTGKPIRDFNGHGAAVTCITFVRDSHLAVTGGADGQLILWNVDTGQALRRFRGHTAPIFDISVSEDGSLLASTSGDHLLRLWNVSSGKELAVVASFMNGAWAIVDPEGRFDASDPDAPAGLRWFVDDKLVADRGIKSRLYTPRLLARILGGERLPKVDLGAPF